MTQALHIFRKDVRCFRLELAVIAALTAAFAWAHIAADGPGVEELSRPSILEYFSSGLLVVGWWFLISQAVHEEALTGDRQFWITRPYSWKQLLCAKVLFVLACVNAPLLLAQIAIFAAAGYSPIAGLPRLLWMQVAATAVLLVPAFALGAVTRNLAQVVLTPLCAILGLYFLLAARSGYASIGVVSIGWPNTIVSMVVIGAGAAFVVFRQFSSRCTQVCILAGLCALVLAGWLGLHIPMTAYYDAQTWLYRQQETRAVTVTLGEPLASINPQGQDFTTVEFPLTFANVPANTVAVPDLVRMRAPALSDGRWPDGWMGTSYEDPVPPPMGPVARYSERLFLSREEYRRLAVRTVVVQVSMYFSLQNATFVPLMPDRNTRAPWGGRCSVSTDRNEYAVFCDSPFRSPYDLVRTPAEPRFVPAGEILQSGTLELLSRRQSPWPAEFALSPVFTDGFRCKVGSTIFMLREEPRAWARRDFRVTLHFPEPQEQR